MPAANLCAQKDVVTVTKSSSVFEVAQLMRAKHVGDVVVIEHIAGKRVPVGILTDRDIVTTVVADNVDCKRVTARDIMSSGVITCLDSDSLFTVVEVMNLNGIRRVPIVDEQGSLVGLISLADILKLVGRELNLLSTVHEREVEIEKMSRPLRQTYFAKDPASALL